MKTALITGATSGIGLEIAKSLSLKNWRILIHGRDPEKIQSACAVCLHAEPYQADLSLLASTRQLATEIRSHHPKLDALILNAGTVTKKREITEEGIEKMFAVNHLAPFVLTAELHSLVPSDGHILNVSTEAHRWIKSLDLDNLQAERKFRVLKHYAATKSANLIATLDWSRRLKERGIRVSAHHPGEVATSFGLHGPLWLRLFWKLSSRRFLPPAQAAQTIVDFLVADSPRSSDIPYYSLGKETEPASHITDPKTGRKLIEATLQFAAKHPHTRQTIPPHAAPK